MKIVFLSIALLIMFFSGCSSSRVSNEAIDYNIQQQNAMLNDLDDEEDIEEDINEEGDELYFLDTKGKILYSGNGSEKSLFGYKIDVLLNQLFYDAKTSLPRKRRGKLYVSVVVGKRSYHRDELLDNAQEFILSHKRYALANTDAQSMAVLKKVLRQERDGIYKRKTDIQLRSASDVVLYIQAKSKSKSKILLKAKLIAKNGQTLATRTTQINLKNRFKNKVWAEVKVLRNAGSAQLFEVMVNPVTQREFYGKGSDMPVSNISFSRANRYCKRKLNGELLQPYVFEYARRALILHKPTGSVTSEIIAPYDEEDQDIYYQEGDNLEVDDGVIVLFDWNTERYYAISNLYRSPETTFRCMRSK